MPSTVASTSRTRTVMRRASDGLRADSGSGALMFATLAHAWAVGIAHMG